MKQILYVLLIGAILSSCSKEIESTDGTKNYDGLFSGLGEASSSGSSASSGGNSVNGNDNGLITAGEWNDLKNWDFWLALLDKDTLGFEQKWMFSCRHRISVEVKNNQSPCVNAKAELRENNIPIWQTTTDKSGKADLFYMPFDVLEPVDLAPLDLYINGELSNEDVRLYAQGVNISTMQGNNHVEEAVDIAFIVDATGSMSDELNFLKEDMKNVIDRVETNVGRNIVQTASVFYRDEGEEYVVKSSNFTNDINKTIQFIQNQEAKDGGDFPEAVHTALEEAFSRLKWREKSKVKLAFLLLDAPPHEDQKTISSLQKSIERAANLGIRIIPITASGINKETEFLMRNFAIATNGTYVFITNDSGIGNEHIEATVGDYEVEFLNDLMSRLIIDYCK